MKLWVDGKAGSAGSAIRATVKEQVTNINRKVVSRGVRAVNAIRNAELDISKATLGFSITSDISYLLCVRLAINLLDFRRWPGLPKTIHESDLYRIGSRRATGKTYRESSYALERTGKKRKCLQWRGCYRGRTGKPLSLAPCGMSAPEQVSALNL